MVMHLPYALRTPADSVKGYIMLHVVSLHLHFVGPHQQLQVVLLQEPLRHIRAEQSACFSAGRLTAFIVHRVGPQDILQQTY